MRKQGNGPTIYDIADDAGVSANTVSRALNGKPGVSEKTRGRIFSIAKTMGYHPNLGARSLRVEQEGLIGLTLPAPVDVVPLSEPFFTFIFSELFRHFGIHGERLCFDLNPYISSASSDYGRSLWQNLYAACVVAGPLATSDTTIHKIHQSGIPYVTLGRLDSLAECSCATVDYEGGAYVGTKYLIEQGHTRIALLKALAGYQPAVERIRGYLRALEEAGIEPDETLIQSVTFTNQNIANSVHRLLKDHTVTALLESSGTEDGSGIQEGSRRAGRVPGKDFEVVCWTYAADKIVLPEASAHLWLPVREAATEGFEQLADWYFGRRDTPINIVYPPTMLKTKDLLLSGAQSVDTSNRLFNSQF